MVTARRQHRRVRIAGLAVALGLVLGAGGLACGGDDDDDDAGTSPTTEESAPTSESPPTTLSPEEEAEATYLEFVAAVERLLSTTRDPEDADLNRLAADPVLGDVRDSLTTMQAENHVVVIGPRTAHNVTAVTLEGSTAEVTDCYVGNDTTTDVDDGRVVDEGLSTRAITATLVQQGATWVVTDVATQQIYDGEVSCAP